MPTRYCNLSGLTPEALAHSILQTSQKIYSKYNNIPPTIFGIDPQDVDPLDSPLIILTPEDFSNEQIIALGGAEGFIIGSCLIINAIRVKSVAAIVEVKESLLIHAEDSRGFYNLRCPIDRTTNPPQLQFAQAAEDPNGPDGDLLKFKMDSEGIQLGRILYKLISLRDRSILKNPPSPPILH